MQSQSARTVAKVLFVIGVAILAFSAWLIVTGTRAAESARTTGTLVAEVTMLRAQAGAAHSAAIPATRLPNGTKRVALDTELHYSGKGSFALDGQISAGSNVLWKGTDAWYNKRSVKAMGQQRRLKLLELGTTEISAVATFRTPPEASVDRIVVRLIADPTDEVEDHGNGDVFIGGFLAFVSFLVLGIGAGTWLSAKIKKADEESGC
jgi:hypothetical protein